MSTLMDQSITEMLTRLATWERIDNLSMWEPNSGCRIWLGHVDKDGYAKMTGPRFAYKRVAVTVSRLVLAMELGRLPNKPALHSCDNPFCINGRHLYEGSYSSNYKDMLRRNRRTIERDEFGKFRT